MLDPFAAPALPDRGEADPDTIYLEVGKLMSGWEAIEFELSILYSVFVDDPYGESMREYGKKAVPRFRLDALATSAETHFQRNPNQEREGEFNCLIGRLLRLLDRRNEVAHGIVFNVERVSVYTKNFAPEFLGKPQYLLIAPYYAFKQHDPDGLPAYGYKQDTLIALFAAMAKTLSEISGFRASLLDGKQDVADDYA